MALKKKENKEVTTESVLSEHDIKVVNLYQSLVNAYLPVDQREEVTQLTLHEEDISGDLVAILEALHLFYIRITKDTSKDLFDLIGLMNKLSVQKLLTEYVNSTEVQENVESR